MRFYPGNTRLEDMTSCAFETKGRTTVLSFEIGGRRFRATFRKTNISLEIVESCPFDVGPEDRTKFYIGDFFNSIGSLPYPGPPDRQKPKDIESAKIAIIDAFHDSLGDAAIERERLLRLCCGMLAMQFGIPSVRLAIMSGLTGPGHKLSLGSENGYTFMARDRRNYRGWLYKLGHQLESLTMVDNGKFKPMGVLRGNASELERLSGHAQMALLDACESRLGITSKDMDEAATMARRALSESTTPLPGKGILWLTNE